MMLPARAERRVLRVEAVDVLEREDFQAAGRFGRQRTLPVIEVQPRIRRQHGVVAGHRGRVRSGHSMPGHDDGVFAQSRPQDFIPADDPPPVCRKITADSLGEIGLQFRRVANPQLPSPRLHRGGCVPFIPDHLIAANVNLAARKQLHDFGQHALEKIECCRFQD